VADGVGDRFSDSLDPEMPPPPLCIIKNGTGNERDRAIQISRQLLSRQLQLILPGGRQPARAAYFIQRDRVEFDAMKLFG